MRIHDHASGAIEQPDAGACLFRRVAERFFVLRSVERNAVAEIGLEEATDQDRLVSHVALERAEQLPLVEIRELEPSDRDEHDDQIDHQQPNADPS